MEQCLSILQTVLMEHSVSIDVLSGTIFFNSLMRTYGAKIGKNVILNEANVSMYLLFIVNFERLISLSLSLSLSLM